jgi:predicted RNase H-like HicB family nuclease
MRVRVFTAIPHKEDDLYVAECPEVGTVNQGCTIEEAVGNLKEATELCLEEFPSLRGGRLPLTTFEASLPASHCVCSRYSSVPGDTKPRNDDWVGPWLTQPCLQVPRE